MNQDVKSILVRSADAPGLRVFLKRLHAPYAFAFATALLISGCSSVPKGAATAASEQSVSAPELAQKASRSAYVSASPLLHQQTTATITDPSRDNMVAATMTIPAGWKLEGIEMMPPCTAAAATDWYRNAHVDSGRS